MVDDKIYKMKLYKEVVAINPKNAVLTPVSIRICNLYLCETKQELLFNITFICQKQIRLFKLQTSEAKMSKQIFINCRLKTLKNLLHSSRNLLQVQSAIHRW